MRWREGEGGGTAGLSLVVIVQSRLVTGELYFGSQCRRCECCEVVAPLSVLLLLARGLNAIEPHSLQARRRKEKKGGRKKGKKEGAEKKKKTPQLWDRKFSSAPRFGKWRQTNLTPYARSNFSERSVVVLKT